MIDQKSFHKWAIVESRRQVKVKAVQYKGGRCQRCGYSGSAIDFHHRDPSLKDFQISDGTARNWLKLVAELDKCDALCANCHREVHELESAPKRTSQLAEALEFAGTENITTAVAAGITIKKRVNKIQVSCAHVGKRYLYTQTERQNLRAFVAAINVQECLIEELYGRAYQKWRRWSRLIRSLLFLQH